MQALSDTIFTFVNIKINQFENELKEFLQTSQLFSQQSLKFQQISENATNNRSSNNLTAKKFEFFDLTTDEFDLIIHLNKHVFYKNVYAFVN